MNSYQKFWNRREHRKKIIIIGILILIYTVGIYFLLKLGILGFFLADIIVFTTYLIFIYKSFKANQEKLLLKKEQDDSNISEIKLPSTDKEDQTKKKIISNFKIEFCPICEYRFNSDEKLIYFEEKKIFCPKCGIPVKDRTLYSSDLKGKILKYGIIITIYQSLFYLLLVLGNSGIVAYLLVTLSSFFGISYLIYKINQSKTYLA